MAKPTGRKKRGANNNAATKHEPAKAETSSIRDEDGNCKYCGAGEGHDAECPLNENPEAEVAEQEVEGEATESGDTTDEEDEAARAFSEAANGARELRTEVNGDAARVVLSGSTGAPIDTDRLIEVSLEELVHTLAKKRAEIREAKTEYSRAGSKVKTLQEDEEKIVLELIRRDERRQQEHLALDEGESEDEAGEVEA